jgi:Tfp pilus assembly protein PilF
MSQGLSSLEKKDYYSSEEAFKAALKEKPDDFKATLYLGIVFDQMGMKEAEDLLKKALLMNPRDPQVNLQLGIHYYSKTVYPEARDYHHRGCAQDPVFCKCRRVSQTDESSGS